MAWGVDPTGTKYPWTHLSRWGTAPRTKKRALVPDVTKYHDKCHIFVYLLPLSLISIMHHVLSFLIFFPLLVSPPLFSLPRLNLSVPAAQAMPPSGDLGKRWRLGLVARAASGVVLCPRRSQAPTGASGSGAARFRRAARPDTA